MSDKAKWRWFGHAGHFICSKDCRFHLCTAVDGYLISTVGELWMSRAVREIHAKHHDPEWLKRNQALLGDTFDAAYMKRFGFEPLGADPDSIYETMVFKAGKVCDAEDCGCGMPVPEDWSEIDGQRSKTAGEATLTHYEFCERWDGVPVPEVA